jgi:hypothetical protein
MEHAGLFMNSPRQEVRQVYGGNPFPEAVEIGAYIRAHSLPADRIVVFGSEPEIYFYAHRKSSSGYIYMYGMTEEQRYAATMLQQFASETAAAHSRYAVLVNVEVSWWIFRTPASRMLQIQELVSNLLRNYRVVGVWNIVSKQQTDVYWGSRPVPRAPYSVVLFERM